MEDFQIYLIGLAFLCLPIGLILALAGFPFLLVVSVFTLYAFFKA